MGRLAPHGGVNARWERDGVGHVPLATILRSISVDDSTRGRQSKLGCGGSTPRVSYQLAFIDGGPLDGRLHVLHARFQLVS